MSAVHGTMKKGPGGLWRLARSPCSFPLLSMPLPLIGYVLSVVACYVALFGWELARSPKNASELALFAALMCCGAICIEGARRLGRPTGVTRDLLSAWWLPVALLLPPVYALAAPAVLGLLCYARVRRGPVYRRVFSSAALGLAGAAASIMFRSLSPVPQEGQAGGWLTYPGSHDWFDRPHQAALAVACAVAFGVLNACLVAVAAWLAEPAGRLADLLWDRGRRHGRGRHDLDRRRVAGRARPGPVRAPRGRGRGAVPGQAHRARPGVPVRPGGCRARHKPLTASL